jgi:hypothetical protein
MRFRPIGFGDDAIGTIGEDNDSDQEMADAPAQFKVPKAVEEEETSKKSKKKKSKHSKDDAGSDGEAATRKKDKSKKKRKLNEEENSTSSSNLPLLGNNLVLKYTKTPQIKESPLGNGGPRPNSHILPPSKSPGPILPSKLATTTSSSREGPTPSGATGSTVSVSKYIGKNTPKNQTLGRNPSSVTTATNTSSDHIESSGNATSVAKSVDGYEKKSKRQKSKLPLEQRMAGTDAEVLNSKRKAAAQQSKSIDNSRRSEDYGGAQSSTSSVTSGMQPNSSKSNLSPTTNPKATAAFHTPILPPRSTILPSSVPVSTLHPQEISKSWHSPSVILPPKPHPNSLHKVQSISTSSTPTKSSSSSRPRHVSTIIPPRPTSIGTSAGRRHHTNTSDLIATPRKSSLTANDGAINTQGKPAPILPPTRRKSEVVPRAQRERES